MSVRSTVRALLGLGTLGLAVACGGELAAPQSDGGAPPDGATAGAVQPVPVTTVAGGSGSSGGSSGAVAVASGSSGGAPPANEGADDAGACGANILTHASGTAFGACWSCIAKGCSSQLEACRVDCACNEGIARALTCSDTGHAGMCFLPTVTSSGDMQETAIGTCILQVNTQCPCANLPAASDDAG